MRLGRKGDVAAKKLQCRVELNELSPESRSGKENNRSAEKWQSVENYFHIY